jgi:phosphomannomutase
MNIIGRIIETIQKSFLTFEHQIFQKQMTLIKSISGIRGTIGGKAGEALTPVDIVKFAAGYGTWLKQHIVTDNYKVVIGRDARISGFMVQNLVIHTLNALGINVINLEFATTPTVEIAVPLEEAQGGIILTASHNPKQWNALKLLNEKGEFLSGDDGANILEIVENDAFLFSGIDTLGEGFYNRQYNQIHIDEILKLPLVDVNAIKKAEFKIAIDCVNSVGGLIIPDLLKKLGVSEVFELYTEPTGVFPHNPEPLPEHLTEISQLVKEKKADAGFVVDPDVDRLAIINEDGTMFGEEYTLVAVADYVLGHKKGNTVSNLSSSMALKDVTEQHGGAYFAAAVGEVNVVEMMKKQQAVIGGEGNGGIIYPDLHYGRDALVGIALFLSHLAKTGKSCSELRKHYPSYVISKNKIQLTPDINVDNVLEKVQHRFKEEEINTADGIKIVFQNKEWVHLRKSNTEPIIRIYAESSDARQADDLARNTIDEIKKLL